MNYWRCERYDTNIPVCLFVTLMFKDYVKKIESANLYDLVQKTPINVASSLSEKLENRIYIKREDLQPVFSFKIRGAYNKLKNLSKLELDRGVTVSYTHLTLPTILLV